MFAIQRYTANDDSSVEQQQSKVPLRLQKLQDSTDSRAVKRARVQEASTVGPIPDSSGPISAPVKDVSAIPANLNIHPSRLQAVPSLKAAQARAIFGSNGATPKTKAKERYLSRKKERRKNKKKSTSAPGPGQGRKSKVHEVEEDVEEPLEDDQQQQEPNGNDESTSRARGTTAPDQSMDQPWRKVRFATPDIDSAAISAQPLQHSQASSSSSSKPSHGMQVDVDDDNSSDSDQSQDIDLQSKQKEKVAPPAALQRFPSARSLAFSNPAVLKLQGLPQGFAAPVVVDAKVTSSLEQTVAGPQTKNRKDKWPVGIESSAENQGGIELVGKQTRARLEKLGIEQFFAGMLDSAATDSWQDTELTFPSCSFAFRVQCKAASSRCF